jgi:hypothetical protein
MVTPWYLNCLRVTCGFATRLSLHPDSNSEDVEHLVIAISRWRAVLKVFNCSFKRRSLAAMASSNVTRPERPMEPTRRGIRTMPALRFVFRRRYRASCFATLELCLAHTSVSYDLPSFYHPGRVSPHIRLIKAVCPSQHDPSTTISPPVTSRLPSGVDAKPR